MKAYAWVPVALYQLQKTQYKEIWKVAGMNNKQQLHTLIITDSGKQNYTCIQEWQVASNIYVTQTTKRNVSV